MKVDPAEIQAMSRFICDLCGIVLDESKDYLVTERLIPVAEAAGCSSFCELYHRARYDDDKALQRAIIDAITTNETLFFRDTSPFEALRYKAGPELIDSLATRPNPRRIRIWSAAASTGQEPYSLAMTMCQMIPDIHEWDVQVLGTDISDAAIRQASAGRYSDLEINRGMEPALLNRYFVREGDAWRVGDELRSLVSFRKVNLLEPFDDLGTFEIIFCRNIAIYFSPENQLDVYQRVADRLSPGGILFVGATETLERFDRRFTPEHHCRAVFYRPEPRRLAA